MAWPAHATLVWETARWTSTDTCATDIMPTDVSTEVPVIATHRLYGAQCNNECNHEVFSNVHFITLPQEGRVANLLY